MIDVIDVEKQDIQKMSINELNTYFKTKPRSKVYNLLSFEISNTHLNKFIQIPSIVREISWAYNAISKLSVKDSIQNIITNNKEPQVHKYCLISAAQSFTDFHIDFGGSSVWYHLVEVSEFIYYIFLKKLIKYF